nr:hypothetical protein GCM10020092_081240 [Actinoplanes digitatis]
MVVGEFERAFAGGEARRIIETLQGYGVQVWLPETDGPVDLTDPDHRACGNTGTIDAPYDTLCLTIPPWECGSPV